MPGYQVIHESALTCIVKWSTLDGDTGSVCRATRREAMADAQEEAMAAQAISHAEWKAKDDRKTLFIYAGIVIITTTVVHSVVWGIYWIFS